MNNRGFTLANLLFFISLFMIILVVCVIVIDTNLSKFEVTYEEIKPKVEDVKNIEDEKPISVIDTNSNKYKKLLEKMANTAKIYISTNYTGTTDQIVIKTSKLVNDEYMEELIDPDNINNKCIGYIIYDGESSYTPYLNCGKNFKSDNYNESFE